MKREADAFTVARMPLVEPHLDGTRFGAFGV